MSAEDEAVWASVPIAEATGAEAVHSALLGTARLILYLGFTLLCIPVQAVLLALGARRASLRFPRLYHRACLRLIGFELQIHGTPTAARPALYISNHTSYFDITVLGAAIEGCFVAKREVAGWPLFGLLAKLQRTVFVERKRSEAAGQKSEIEARLGAGDRLILFPEGTSNDGNRTLPFKTALFAAAAFKTADGQALTVQPVSLAYTALDGIPLGRRLRPLLAWYGDMAMGGHLWQALGLGRITAALVFHPPVTLDQLGTRKALARHCEEMVSTGVSALIAGRDPAAPGPGVSSNLHMANS